MIDISLEILEKSKESAERDERIKKYEEIKKQIDSYFKEKSEMENANN